MLLTWPNSNNPALFIQLSAKQIRKELFALPTLVSDLAYKDETIATLFAYSPASGLDLYPYHVNIDFHWDTYNDKQTGR